MLQNPQMCLMFQVKTQKSCTWLNSFCDCNSDCSNQIKCFTCKTQMVMNSSVLRPSGCQNKNSARQFKKNLGSFVAAKLSLLLTLSSVFTGVLCVEMDKESAYCQTEHQSQSRGSKIGPAVSMATSKQTSVSGFCSPPQGSLTQKQ